MPRISLHWNVSFAEGEDAKLPRGSRMTLKRNYVGALLVAVLLVASCGGSSSSDRNRNTILDLSCIDQTMSTAEITSITLKVNCAGAKKVGFNGKGGAQLLNASNELMIPLTIGDSGMSLNVTTLDANDNPIAEELLEISVADATSCATGGSCAVGDIGPSGGYVFYDAGQYRFIDAAEGISAGGRFLEMAPAGWYQNQTEDPKMVRKHPDCTSTIGSTSIYGLKVGTGAWNTRLDAFSTCSNSTASTNSSITTTSLNLNGQNSPLLGQGSVQIVESAYVRPATNSTVPSIASINAIDVVAGLRLKRFDDWFLASRDEATLIERNLFVNNKGALSESYWTSSVFENADGLRNVWVQLYKENVSSPGADSPDLTYIKVRPIRAFTPVRNAKVYSITVTPIVGDSVAPSTSVVSSIPSSDVVVPTVDSSTSVVSSIPSSDVVVPTEESTTSVASSIPSSDVVVPTEAPTTSEVPDEYSWTEKCTDAPFVKVADGSFTTDEKVIFTLKQACFENASNNIPVYISYGPIRAGGKIPYERNLVSLTERVSQFEFGGYFPKGDTTYGFRVSTDYSDPSPFTVVQFNVGEGTKNEKHLCDVTDLSLVKDVLTLNCPVVALGSNFGQGVQADDGKSFSIKLEESSGWQHTYIYGFDGFRSIDFGIVFCVTKCENPKIDPAFTLNVNGDQAIATATQPCGGDGDPEIEQVFLLGGNLYASLAYDYGVPETSIGTKPTPFIIDSATSALLTERTDFCSNDDGEEMYSVYMIDRTPTVPSVVVPDATKVIQISSAEVLAAGPAAAPVVLPVAAEVISLSTSVVNEIFATGIVDGTVTSVAVSFDGKKWTRVLKSQRNDIVVPRGASKMSVKLTNDTGKETVIEREVTYADVPTVNAADLSEPVMTLAANEGSLGLLAYWWLYLLIALILGAVVLHRRRSTSQIGVEKK